MAETHDPQNPSDGDDELKQGLLRRVAIAGVLVVVLLGGLAMFDALNAPSADKKLAKLTAVPPSEPTAAKPAEPGADAKASEEKATEPAASEAEKPEETSAPAERTEAPTGTLPSAMGDRAATLPARARAASVRPSEPVLELQRPDAATEIAKATPAARIKHAPASRPLTQAAERSRQYVLQMGVFNSVANAEELRAKLELAGVPAQIEARVQVGPFGTRQEAESAREKLRSLGMESGFLTALRK